MSRTKLGPQQVFEPRDPPPGGLDGLRTRLDRLETRPRPAPIWVLSSAALVGVLVSMGYLALRHPVPLQQSSLLRSDAQAPIGLVALGLAPADTSPVTLGDRSLGQVAIRQVPLQDDKVVFYLVASMPAASDGPTQEP